MLRRARPSFSRSRMTRIQMTRMRSAESPRRDGDIVRKLNKPWISAERATPAPAFRPVPQLSRRAVRTISVPARDRETGQPVFAA